MNYCQWQRSDWWLMTYSVSVLYFIIDDWYLFYCCVDYCIRMWEADCDAEWLSWWGKFQWPMFSAASPTERRAVQWHDPSFVVWFYSFLHSEWWPSWLPGSDLLMVMTFIDWPVKFLHWWPVGNGGLFSVRRGASAGSSGSNYWPSRESQLNIIIITMPIVSWPIQCVSLFVAFYVVMAILQWNAWPLVVSVTWPVGRLYFSVLCRWYCWLKPSCYFHYSYSWWLWWCCYYSFIVDFSGRPLLSLLMMIFLIFVDQLIIEMIQCISTYWYILKLLFITVYCYWYLFIVLQYSDYSILGLSVKWYWWNSWCDVVMWWWLADIHSISVLRSYYCVREKHAKKCVKLADG